LSGFSDLPVAIACASAGPAPIPLSIAATAAELPAILKKSRLDFGVSKIGAIVSSLDGLLVFHAMAAH
jgi:hypothetical protein